MLLKAMLSRFFRPRQIWWPTFLGWLILVIVFLAPLMGWFFGGENFLATTRREVSEVLVVEGWIGYEGVEAARKEFEQGGYRLIVTAGGPTNNVWGRQKWNAVLAREHLIRLGVQPDQVLEAPIQYSESHRTFESAAEVVRTLQAHNRHPSAINIFTAGPHARRSRLVYAKAFASETKVGVIAWVSPMQPPGAWWQSSERASSLLKETAAWLFELLLNSGRSSNSIDPKTS